LASTSYPLLTDSLVQVLSDSAKKWCDAGTCVVAEGETHVLTVLVNNSPKIII
jgi:hypothetical protein